MVKNDMAVLTFLTLLSFIFWVAVIYAGYKYFKYTTEILYKQKRYIQLYELYKIEEQLKARGLSFDKLDELNDRLFGRHKTPVERLDEAYAPDKKKEAKKEDKGTGK